MRIDIITIFPGYFEPLRMSLIGKAAARGDIRVNVHDLRTWSHDAHHRVDDTPYGGGPGMVMKAEPWGEALDAVAPADPGPAPRLVVPAPSGPLFTQQVAARYAREPHLVFACGRYEGIDARVIEEARTRMPVDEVSIGDYVLAGGEAAVLVMVEAICRLLPGVLGNAESVADDSFGGGGGVLRAWLATWMGATRPVRSAACRRLAWRCRVGCRRRPRPRPVGWRACSKARSTRSRESGAGMTFLPCCSRVTMRPSGGGGGTPRCGGPRRCAPRWSECSILRALDARDREVLSEAGFPVHSEDVAH